MTNTLPKIGWVGLGKMGTPMCGRLKAAGYELTVRVRNEDGRRYAEALSLSTVTTFAALAERADIVFSAVSDDTALLDIVFSEGGLGSVLRHGQIFVDTSTVSPMVSHQVADALAESGVGYVRAPVSGSTASAEAGQLTVMLSGSPQDCVNCQPPLLAFSARQFVVGRAEEARYIKLAINSMLGGISALVAEALAFGARGGLDVKSMLEVMNASVVATPLLGYKTAMLENGDYSPAFTVGQMMKDLDLFLIAGGEAHCPLPVATEIRRQFEAARAAGDGEKDFFALAGRALGVEQSC